MKNTNQRKLRHRRIRARVKGTEVQPRMNVFRSASHIYVQIIDDSTGRTLVAANSHEIKEKAAKKQIAALVGKLAAEKAQKAGLKKVAFDRGGYQYHGRVKELATAARLAGLEF